MKLIDGKPVKRISDLSKGDMFRFGGNPGVMIVTSISGREMFYKYKDHKNPKKRKRSSQEWVWFEDVQIESNPERRALPIEQQLFIRNNASAMTLLQIARKLGLKKTQVQWFCRSREIPYKFGKGAGEMYLKPVRI